jgi:hypothetical protein
MLSNLEQNSVSLIHFSKDSQITPSAKIKNLWCLVKHKDNLIFISWIPDFINIL